MYKAESVLGLIGSILETVFSVIVCACLLIGGTVVNALGPSILEEIKSEITRTNVHFDFTALFNLLPGIIIIVAIVGFIIGAASFVLGYIGTSKLNKNEKSGGVFLIVAGVLAFFSMWGFIPFVLFLIGGIMAAAKKQPAA